MTQIFREDGTVVPVTRVAAGPCTVTQVKTEAKDGVNSVQIGFGTQKQFRVGKAQQGHLKDLPMVRVMKEFRTTEADSHLERGTTFTVATFEAGEKVKVTGTSKGKGFQGVVKRHGFAGAISSHGTKDQVRMPGSIGATGPARVFKGTRMGGHMGAEQVTISNLEIAAIDEEKNELLIKGAVPGAKGSYLYVYTSEGSIEPVADATPEVEETTPEAEEVTEEAPAEEATEEVAAEETPESTDDKKETTEESTPEVAEESSEEEKTEENPSADAQDNPSTEAQDKA